MLEHLARCRAVCFPPYDEDYGFVTVEAFASRKPVMTCTDSGGPAELVSDDVNGKVCAPRPETLAVALREVMDDARGCRAARSGRPRAGLPDDMVGRGQAVADDMTTKPGILASALLGILLLAFAVSVDFPKANGGGFKGRRVDLLRARPQPRARLRFSVRAQGSDSRLGGVFRTRGHLPEDGQGRRDSRLQLVSVLPMGQTRRSRARDAALFFEVVHLSARRGAVRLFFGTNGFLVLHAILIAFDLLVIYLFILAATKSNWVALPLAIAFLAASVVPVYFVWLMPELLQFLARALCRVLLGIQGSRGRPADRHLHSRLLPGRRRTTSRRCSSGWRRSRSRRICSCSCR